MAPVDETVRFGIGGTDYKIGLITKPRCVSQATRPLIEHAWRAGREVNAGASPSASSGRSKAPPEDGDAGLTRRRPEPALRRHWLRRPVNDAGWEGPTQQVAEKSVLPIRHSKAWQVVELPGLGRPLPVHVDSDLHQCSDP
jgi:hypothetical protein